MTEILPFPITKEIQVRRHKQAQVAHYEKEVNRLFNRLWTPLQSAFEELRT